MSTRREEEIRYSAAQLFQSQLLHNIHMPDAREGSPRGSVSPPLDVILILACISHFRKHL